MQSLETSCCDAASTSPLIFHTFPTKQSNEPTTGGEETKALETDKIIFARLSTECIPRAQKHTNTARQQQTSNTPTTYIARAFYFYLCDSFKHVAALSFERERHSIPFQVLGISSYGFAAVGHRCHVDHRAVCSHTHSHSHRGYHSVSN